MGAFQRFASFLGRLFNQLVAWMLPVVPRAIVGRVASRYIAGETLDDAVAVVRELNRQGFKATIDVLGEEITEQAQADAAVATYLEVLERIRAERLDSGVSLKLTQFGLRLDRERCLRHLLTVVQAAHERDLFVRVDMEDSSLTDVTLDLVRQARARFPNVGAVLQAYLHRTQSDAERLAAEGIGVRLCKGIYREPPEVAFQDREDVRESYMKAARALLDGPSHVALATHDTALIAALRQHLTERATSRNNYEFQALLGVPISALLEELVREGHGVRLYVPFGSHWYPYSVRRLKENPQMAGYVFQGMFRRDRGLLRGG
jgi:proline dehydrogenase